MFSHSFCSIFTACRCLQCAIVSCANVWVLFVFPSIRPDAFSDNVYLMCTSWWQYLQLRFIIHLFSFVTWQTLLESFLTIAWLLYLNTANFYRFICPLHFPCSVLVSLDLVLPIIILIIISLHFQSWLLPSICFLHCESKKTAPLLFLL